MSNNKSPCAAINLQIIEADLEKRRHDAMYDAMVLDFIRTKPPQDVNILRSTAIENDILQTKLHILKAEYAACVASTK